MKPFNLSVGSIIIRFYLMMAVIVIAGFSGQWWIAFFSLPIFLSAILGVGQNKEKKQKTAKVSYKKEKIGNLTPSY